jgi:serine/threonine protein kinase
MTEPQENSPDLSPAPHALENCPSCGAEIDMTGLQPFTEVACPACGGAFTARARFDHFEIQSLLGEGGMGSVYQAVDTNLDREVALKVLKLALSSNPGECEKLEREARTTALINHPHIIKIFDFGRSQGQFYIAMELIGGGSLDDLIQTYGTVPEKMVLQVGIQVAQGLEAALEQGLIHRDIKPANILFADIDTAKLVDFGLAMVMSDAAQARGEIWGTPYYIAPEKLDEQPEDFRSDIYSLGGTLFHALAGRPPYEAESASLVALKQLKSRPVSLQAFAPDVSNETAYVINRMMAKNPEKRYATYQELVEHLQFALEKARDRESNPQESKKIPVVEEKSPNPWMSMIMSLIVPALILLGAVALGVLYYLFPELFKAAD